MIYVIIYAVLYALSRSLNDSPTIEASIQAGFMALLFAVGDVADMVRKIRDNQKLTKNGKNDKMK